MRVGINALVLGNRVGGDETYFRNLLQSLVKIDPEGTYTVFLAPPAPGEPASELPPGLEDVKKVVVRPRQPLIRVPITFPLALATQHIDVVHLQYVAPPLCPSRIVVTVHDIAYEHYPEFFPESVVRNFRRHVPRTITQAAVVLTVSEFSRRDIIEYYGVAPEKVIVAPNAADPIFRPINNVDTLDAVRARYDTGRRFILCVGNVQPRKNLRRVIDAYLSLREANRIGHKLVLVGRKAWKFDETLQAARESAYADDIIFTDYVPAEDLVALYNAADLFVYPSIFEGFGLPPIEAMACGTPVITSSTSALPEVVGDAAVTVDPLDGETLASEMERVLSDEMLAHDLSQRGLERAGHFSWHRTAEITREAYRRAMA